MNVAGPSRVQPSGRLASRGGVESTYEDDLLGLLDRLSLDEMDEMQSFFTLRTRAGHPLSDHDVAMNDLLQQARALAVLNQDRALAQSIATGDVTGQTPAQRPVPAVPLPNGNGTAAQRNDHQQHPEQPAARSDTAPSQTWGGWLSSVVDWVCGVEPVSKPHPTNADTAVPRIPVVNRPTGHDCVICQDPIYGAEIRAPCGHYYGIDCIKDLFQSATRDETLFPPRCCRQNIPFVQVQPHLSQELITTFQQKQVEFGTLKRVYCSSPTCSRFLGPISEGFFDSRVYTCPAPGCGRRTCGRCREQHSGDWGHTCRPDTEAAQVLELGRASGWARCPGCSQLIELHVGCFHMTCRCRTEFCYLCRARWKTCPCPQWDERRLMVAAEERVDAQLGVGRARGARRDVPPVRNPIVIPANRAPAPAPAPAPVPAQRPVPARPVVPPRPVETRYPPPIPPRTPTASSSAVRPASTASTPLREGTDHTLWRSRLAAASTVPTNTGTAAQTSGSGWRARMASATTSGVASASASTSASASSSASPTALTSESGWRARMASTTTSGVASASASTSASSSASPTALASGSGWRARMASTTTSELASGSRLTKTPTSASTPSVTRPKTIHNDNVDQMRRDLVREMMDRLREDHECDHTRWGYRHGGGVCQTCGHHLPLYLFRCQGCEMLACKRCKCNRL